MSKSSISTQVIGIDLSNIRLGGGITHIKELLNHSTSDNKLFDRVIVWGAAPTLNQLPDHEYLEKIYPSCLEKGLFFRFIWQTVFLSYAAKKMCCTVLLIPGGTYLGFFQPFVVMSQNLLPFESKEIARFGITIRAFKFLLLRIIQTITFRRSQGVIFLTNYARDIALKVVGKLENSEVTVVPHGLSERFNYSYFDRQNAGLLVSSSPIRIIYVSNVDVYKHQIHVLEAIYSLRCKGYLLSIDFIGPAISRSLTILTERMNQYDPPGKWAKYCGHVSYEEMPNVYKSADIAVFASSCETFGITLLEKMASSLPIACSNVSSMPEILADGGLYFNPEDPVSIANAIEQYLLSAKLRVDKMQKSYEISRKYSWEDCSARTFCFMAKVAQRFKK